MADVDGLLDKIRINSIHLSNAHKAMVAKLEESLKWYKMPVIVISGLSSLLSVSQAYIPQYYITAGNSAMGLICSIIVSLEMYFRISVRLAQASQLTKSFYSLATDIFKHLSLDTESRTDDPTAFLEQCYGQYTSLCENSYVVSQSMTDSLLPLTEITTVITKPHSSSSGSSGSYSLNLS